MTIEAYLKKGNIHLYKILRDCDRGLSLDGQVSFQNNIIKYLTRTKRDIHESNILKAKYDKVFKSDDYSNFKYVAVRIDQHLPIVTSGGKFPDFDFERNPLFDGDKNFKDPPLVQINIVNDQAGAVASIAWLSNDIRMNKFAASFIRIVKARGADFLVQLGITTCENTFYSPIWWEALDREIKMAFRDAAFSGDGGFPPWHEAISNPINLGLKGKIIAVVSSSDK